MDGSRPPHDHPSQKEAEEVLKTNKQTKNKHHDTAVAHGARIT